MDRSQILAELLDFVGRELLQGDTRGLDEATPLLEWGVLDSLSMVELLAFIERRFSIRVPDAEVRPTHFRSLGALTALLERLAAARAAS